MTTWGGWEGSRRTCPTAVASRVYRDPLRILIAIRAIQDVGVCLIRDKQTTSIPHFNGLQVRERMRALARIPTGPLNQGQDLQTRVAKP